MRPITPQSGTTDRSSSKWTKRDPRAKQGFGWGKSMLKVHAIVYDEATHESLIIIFVRRIEKSRIICRTVRCIATAYSLCPENVRDIVYKLTVSLKPSTAWKILISVDVIQRLDVLNLHSKWLMSVTAYICMTFPLNLSQHCYLPWSSSDGLSLYFQGNGYWTVAPCGLRGCKNWPAPFPGRMSYKATKPDLVCFMS